MLLRAGTAETRFGFSFSDFVHCNELVRAPAAPCLSISHPHIGRQDTAEGFGSSRSRWAVHAVDPRQRASEARSMFPPEAGEREGAPASALARYASRATRAFPRRRRAAGDTAGVARWRQTRDAATRAGRANWSGRASRGGESEAKALAVAGRGAGEPCEAGRGDCARSA